jgi:hypothetical protein
MRHAAHAEEMAAQGADKVSAYLQKTAEALSRNTQCGGRDTARHAMCAVSALRGCSVSAAGVPRRYCGRDAYFYREVNPRTHAAEQEERDARNHRKSDADVPVMTTVATYRSGPPPPVPVPMHRGEPSQSRCRCGQGRAPVPVQMWQTAPMATKATKAAKPIPILQRWPPCVRCHAMQCY